MKISEEWAINSFAKLSIVFYYILTVLAFLAIEYYALEVSRIDNTVVLFVILTCTVILSALFLSKFATQPLIEYTQNLQELSKETLHELNLPISTIHTNTQMLKRNLSSDEKMLKRLSRIESACDMLQQRYNELDYLIKTQSRQELQELVNLYELVEQRVHFLQRVYPDFSFQIIGKNYTVEVDKIGLCKVIDNIVDNGVKYSGSSKKIDIVLRDFCLEIKDYGIGMDEVELLHIYDTFYQSDKNMQGFGIGLSMVKRFCDRNSIGLHVNSTPNKGTTVSLQFKETDGSN